MCIGVFDSGLGGITVVRKIFKYLPGYRVIYFGDTARLPYGNRSKETVQKYSFENAKFLIQKGAKIIVVACNTSSALAINYLKRRFKLPILGVIEPAIQKVLKVTSEGKVGIIGTRGTIESGIFPKLIKKFSKIKVYQETCPLLVPLVEEGWINHRVTQEVIKDYLKPLKTKRIDTLILACTHYPYLKKQIRKIIGNDVFLIDPGHEVVLKLKDFLRIHPEIKKKLSKGGPDQFFVSDITSNLQHLAQKWLGRKIKFKKHV